jgi:hypothetical protein
VNLYWQDVNSIRKMPIRGGNVTKLDATSPNTPTAGLALQNGNIIYASGADIRYVPKSGAITSPLVRTIAKGSGRVTALHAASNGVYWGEQNGAIRMKAGSTITTLPSTMGLVPTSIWADGNKVVWTQCSSTLSRLHFHSPTNKWSKAIDLNALGVAISSSSGQIFWGDDGGVHRQ